MDRIAIAADVADTLLATETAVETALARGVGLMRRLMEARRQMGLPVDAGEPALRRANAAVAALGEAHREILRTRDELGTLRRDLGLPPATEASVGEANAARAPRSGG